MSHYDAIYNCTIGNVSVVESDTVGGYKSDKRSLFGSCTIDLYDLTKINVENLLELKCVINKIKRRDGIIIDMPKADRGSRCIFTFEQIAQAFNIGQEIYDIWDVCIDEYTHDDVLRVYNMYEDRDVNLMYYSGMHQGKKCKVIFLNPDVAYLRSCVRKLKVLNKSTNSADEHMLFDVKGDVVRFSGLAYIK